MWKLLYKNPQDEKMDVDEEVEEEESDLKGFIQNIFDIF